METTLAKLTVTEMEANPSKWERFELYKGEPVEMTYTKPNHARILMILGARKSIQAYYPDNTARTFHIEDTITPGDWMKGFSLVLKEVFS